MKILLGIVIGGMVGYIFGFAGVFVLSIGMVWGYYLADGIY